MLSSVLELLPNFKSTYFASMNPPIVTLALDRNALSDVHGLNLQYHCKTVSRLQILFCWPEEKIMAENELTSKTVLQMNSFKRGYQEIWTAEIGDEQEHSSESHLTRLITTLQQLSAKEKVGCLRRNASSRMNQMARPFFNMFLSFKPYCLKNF